MSSNCVLTEPVAIKKMFKWTINKFNELDALHLTRECVRISRYVSNTVYHLNSPTMTAIDPYDGKEYTAVFRITFKDIRGNFSIVPDVRPCGNFRYYFYKNDETESTDFAGDAFTFWDAADIEKLTIFVDVFGVRNFDVSPFKKLNRDNVPKRLKEMWKNDSTLKFTIKCGKKAFVTYKPFLVSSSFFFKDMFESGMTQSFLEISDFGAVTVEKMVEFCETGDIKYCKGYEDQLFKIAHKLQISELMDFTVEKMSENADTSNIFGYLQLATDYKLKDFEDWCRQFAFRTKVNVQ